MANKRVDFVVTAPDGMVYWLAVGKDDVPLVNGAGSIDLEEGEHVLVWWMIGNPGDSLAIVGKQGNRVVVIVKESKIPRSRKEAGQGAGYRKFTVS